MELRKFYGQSGKVYYVTHSPETHWHAFTETDKGFRPAVAKEAAIDRGAQGERFETNTHKFWSQIWKAA